MQIQESICLMIRQYQQNQLVFLFLFFVLFILLFLMVKAIVAVRHEEALK